MTQVTVNTDPGASNQQPIAVVPAAPADISSGAGTAASNNLSWAIGVVLIIAAIAIALVFVFHNIHF
jgi:hypothetical protein